jgi:hypothetical protein
MEYWNHENELLTQHSTVPVFQWIRMNFTTRLGQMAKKDSISREEK